MLEVDAERIVKSLSLWQRILLKINGYVFLYYEKREGWSKPLPIYLVKCKKHGFYFDYPQGYKEYFMCPKCLEEEVFV